MKSFIISVIIGILVVWGCMYSTHCIERVSAELKEDNKKIVEFLKKDDYEEAEKVADNMSEYLDKEKTRLAIIMDHTDLDKIELGIAELEGYIEGKIKTDALAKCSMIDVMVRHMPKNYKVKFENVL